MTEDYIDEYGVRFKPKVLVFDKVRNEEMTREFTIQNVTSNKVSVSIQHPKLTKLRLPGAPIHVSIIPGLQISRKVILSAGVKKDLNATFDVHIDKYIYHYPVTVRVASAKLVVDPTEVDMGSMDMGSPAAVKHITLYNTGSLASNYFVDRSLMSVGLSVSPNEGIIPPQSQQTLRIEMAGLCEEGQHELSFWIKGTEEQMVIVRGTVVLPRFVAHHPCTTGEFTLIHFPTTYYGTQRNLTMIVQNNSSNISTFVVLADINDELMELRHARKKMSHYNMFSVDPIEGRMQPFEGRIFTFCFRPVMLPQINGEEPCTEFVVYVQVLRIHCMDYTDIEKTLEKYKGKRKVSAMEQKQLPYNEVSGIITSYPSILLPMNRKEVRVTNTGTLRVCLYGEVISPDVMVRPTEIHLGEVLPHEAVERELFLYNRAQLSIHIQLSKTTSIIFRVSEITLQAKESIKVDFVIKPCTVGPSDTDIKIILMSTTSPLHKDQHKMIVGHLAVPVKYNAVAVKTLPKSVFNMGITPMITNEIGKIHEKITFTSNVEVPRASVVKRDLSAKKKGLVNIKSQKTMQRIPIFSDETFNSVISSESGTSMAEQSHRVTPCCVAEVIEKKGWFSDKPEDALIAFPNDRPRSLRPWPERKKIRAIFTKTERYSAPVDKSYTLTPEEFARKKKHNDYYFNYLRLIGQENEKHRVCAEDSLQVTRKRRSTLTKEQMEQLNSLKVVMNQEYVAAESKNILIPLSPMQLYNLKMTPQAINFGQVAPFSQASQLIRLNNHNRVPVQLRLLGIDCREKRIVPPEGKADLEFVCYFGPLGRFNGTIEYVLNEHHKSEVILSANVVPKTLTLEPEKLEFPMSDNENAFPRNAVSVELRNSIRSPVHFSWQQPENSSFSINPTEGCVPELSIMLCELVYIPIPRISTHDKMQMISESGEVKNLLCSKRLRKPRISLIPKAIEIENLSLNIRTTVSVLLVSEVFEAVSFFIPETNLIPGVTVDPCQGVVRPRGSHPLAVHLCLSAILSFQCSIPIKITGTDYTIKLPVTGTVNFPKVKIKPSVLHIGRKRAESSSVQCFTAENQSTVEARLTFDFTTFPEFYVSISKLGNTSLRSETITLPPDSTKKLYLHFNAQDVATYGFYLPLIINGLLGPPIMGDKCSLKPKTYLNQFTKLYNSAMLIMDDIPEQLPLMYVTCTVAKRIFSLSKSEVKFKMLPDYDRSYDVLFIKSEYRSDLSIIIEKPTEGPFRVHVNGGEFVEEDAETIRVKLVPHDYIYLDIAFKPTELKEYTADCYIHVAEPIKEERFRSIKITGIWLKPLLISLTPEVIFSPVPLGKSCTKNAAIKNLYNTLHGEITISVEPQIDDANRNMSETLTVTLGGEAFVETEPACYIGVNITFCSIYPVGLRTRVFFQDQKSGSTCEITVVAIADNCSFTHHAFQVTPLDRFETVTNQGSDDSPLMTIDELQGNDDISEQKVERELSSYLPEKNTEDSSENKVPFLETVSNENDTFPFFPPHEDDSYFARHMRGVLRASEIWVRERAFRGARGVKIPDGFTVISPNGNCGQPLLLYELLTKLAGSAALQYFPCPTLSDDQTECVLSMHKIYSQLLLFLKVQGAYLPHVLPEYLFDYVHYEILFELQRKRRGKEKQESDSLMKADKYYALCTQCWLDIILQMQKIFYLAKISTKAPKMQILKNNSWQSTSQISRIKLDIDVDQETKNTYSIGELLLLSWLTNSYNKQRSTLWNDVPIDRELVINFNKDLRDGIVLTAVTAQYCPYLVPVYFKTLYLRPEDSSQMFHNARLLVDAWDAIGLGYTVQAVDIFQAENPFMLGLVLYLYDYLPQLYPTECIRFRTPLATETKRVLTIENVQLQRIGFFPKIIDDVHGLFSIKVSARPIILKADQHKLNVPINFHARKIKECKATLVLCGSLVANCYARSMAFRLDGAPDSFSSSASFNLRPGLYLPTQKNLPIQIPFSAGDTEYEIWMTDVEPTVEGDNIKINGERWSVLSKRKAPRRLFLNQSVLPVAKDSNSAFLSVTLTTLNPSPQKYWLLFFHQKVGDFIVKVEVKTKNGTTLGLIMMDLPTKECACLGNPDTMPFCGRTLKVPIPCRNTALWKAIADSFQRTLPPAESDFWNTYLETKIGLRLMQWLVGESRDSVVEEFRHIFKTSVTYNIATTGNLSKFIMFNKQLLIPDVLKQESVPLLAHVNEDIPENISGNLTLVSEDKKEIRTYRLVLSSKAEQEPDQSLENLTSSPTSATTNKIYSILQNQDKNNAS